MANNSNSGLSILGIIIILAIIYLIIKHLWTFVIIAAVLLILIAVAIILLIKASKKTKPSDSIKEQIRTLRSKIRQQKFKAENNIKRLSEWAADAIYTTYSDLFGDKYTKSELLENYEKIRADYATKIDTLKANKCDEIVNSYLSIINAEKSKIEALEKMDVKYKALYDQILKSERERKQMQKLDSHYKKIEAFDADIEGEKTIANSELNYDEIRKELEYKQEYFKQLEELSYKYNNKLSPQMLPEYKQELENILNNL